MNATEQRLEAELDRLSARMADYDASMIAHREAAEAAGAASMQAYRARHDTQIALNIVRALRERTAA